MDLRGIIREARDAVAGKRVDGDAIGRDEIV